MRIGVISDTHIPISSKKLPKKVYEYFKDCDLIVHAGDIVEPEVIEELSALAEIKAVRGNMDSIELQQSLPEKITFEAGGKKIGVIHGSGPPFKVQQVALESFKSKLDIIIFGHTHTPINEEKDGTLFFNPGSPTDNIFAKKHTFGIIEIDGGKIKAEIIEADD